MEYTVHKLSQLSGVSARTLRYYHEIGLLKPLRVAESGYRIYGEGQLDRLQQILFFRQLGMDLKGIQAILEEVGFDRATTLEGHLIQLTAQREQINQLIENVQKTILALKGEITMTDSEKFEGFKRERIQKNEAAYGTEIRERYGVDTVEQSNRKLQGMTPHQWERQEQLAEEILTLLAQLVGNEAPSSPQAMALCELHREWICLFWPEGHYSKESHKGLADLYTADERMAAYYNRRTPGGTEYLRNALYIYCDQ